LVIASDLSAELLVLLKDFLQQKRLRENCLLLQLNAEELHFTERTFDLVVGAAALHHLFAPEKTIEGCAKILKRGGYAIFFEPFENGHALLNLAYRDILREEQSHSLPEEIRNFLISRIQEYDLRKGRDKTRPELSSVDDKWFFTRQYFWEMAERYGFMDCTIYPLYPLDLVARQFTLQTEINLGLTFSTERGTLPKWAWQIIEKYDNAFSEDFKKESLLEGTVILRK
jgi:ubiquinone/menaquinone biosynthesis C-methylase UbiE